MQLLALQPFFSREVWRDEACLGYGRGEGVEERCSGIGWMDGDRKYPTGEQKVRKCDRQRLRPGQVLVHPSNRTGF